MEDTITRWLPPPDPAGPVTCARCGCRLIEAKGFDGSAWRHFPSLHHGQDARGCRPKCVNELHGRDGEVSEMLKQVALLIARSDEDEAVRIAPRRAEDAAAA